MINDFLLQQMTNFAASGACKSKFFGFPTWYEYLPANPPDCAPRLTGLNDIWLIALAITSILLRVAILAAIAFTLFSGIKYAAARGNPDKLQSARNTLFDAITGLIIAIVAAAVVGFVAGRFNQ